MRALLSILLVAAAFGAAEQQAAVNIADCFRLYYAQYHGSLGFLQEAVAAHADATSVLKAAPTRTIVVDRANGYLRIDDGSNTDQILTMALYRKSDRGLLLVVGGSDCDDACEYSVEIFAVADGRLRPVPLSDVVPAIQPKEFIKPGYAMPKVLAALTPSINYVPARVGTSLTLSPWYGYEVEEQMDRATKAVVRRNLVLEWDAKQGRFVRP